MPPSPTAALSGVRVLEIGAYMAAPFGAMQLADLGAEVIKIENPSGGDPVRDTGPFLEEHRLEEHRLQGHDPDGADPAGRHSSPFARLNRNKRSVALDLKHDDGKAALRRLLQTADVLIENLRPGTLTRLGFGYEEVRELNPRLVYVSASGWGQDGPLSQLPGLDIMAQARSGLMSITGMPGGDPVKIGVPICDLVCGLYIAIGTLGALRAREVTGEGQQIDVSLFESGVSFAIWEAGKYFATGEAGSPLGSAHQSSAPYQAVRTADGWATVGAVSPRTWQGFCTALGLEALMDDERYADAFIRQSHRDTLIPAIEEVTERLRTDELVDALQRHGVPCAPIADTAQVFDDEHLGERDFFWDAPHPGLGSVRQLGSPVRMSGTPAVRGAAGPLLGGDTTDVLAEAGLDAATVQSLIDRGVAAVPDSADHECADHEAAASGT